jgi:predicted  nucleic acid-binding Zn-ribbon protein
VTAVDPTVLSRLVAFDRKVDELQRSLDAGRRKLTELEAQESGAGAELDAAKGRVTEAKLSVRKSELEIADLKRQAALHKGHLNEIADAREWRALNEEIRYIQRQIEEREEQTLTAMEMAEKAEGGLSGVASAIEARRQELADAKQVVVAERARVQAALEQAIAERQAFVASVPAVTLRWYERQARRFPMPVVWLWEGACSFCHKRLTPQAQIEVKRMQALITCEGCGRIVVAPPANGAPAVAQDGAAEGAAPAP